MQIGILVTNRRGLEEAADWDFDYLEGFPGLLGPDEDDPPAERECLALIEKSPLPMTTLCGFIPDPQGRGLMVVGPDVSLDRLRVFVTRIFDRMQRAGIEVIGYGSGGSRWVPDGFDPDKARQQVADFLHLCADLGEPRNVKVALEPYNTDDANLLNTVPDALALVKEIDRTHAKLMADFFHMKLNGESFDALQDAGPHLIHAHIAEPGRDRPRTTPEDHALYLQALRQSGYDGRVTLTGILPAYADYGETAIALKKAIA
jgi:sugar phosphate isomerase/epimerase